MFQVGATGIEEGIRIVYYQRYFLHLTIYTYDLKEFIVVFVVSSNK
jgi:hypothetical protein